VQPTAQQNWLFRQFPALQNFSFSALKILEGMEHTLPIQLWPQIVEDIVDLSKAGYATLIAMIKLYRNYGDFLGVAADASFVTLFVIVACLVAEAAAFCFSINLTTSVVR
jgi:hypothetical protein